MTPKLSRFLDARFIASAAAVAVLAVSGAAAMDFHDPLGMDEVVDHDYVQAHAAVEVRTEPAIPEGLTAWTG